MSLFLWAYAESDFRLTRRSPWGQNVLVVFEADDAHLATFFLTDRGVSTFCFRDSAFSLLSAMVALAASGTRSSPQTLARKSGIHSVLLANMLNGHTKIFVFGNSQPIGSLQAAKKNEMFLFLFLDELHSCGNSPKWERTAQKNVELSS